MVEEEGVRMERVKKRRKEKNNCEEKRREDMK